MPAIPADKPRNRARPVRSFVRRAGRMTPAQRRALAELWPRYGIDNRPAMLDLHEVFGRRALRILEIGFGDGELLVQTAADHPERDFIGIEVHEPGVGHCLLRIAELGLTNVRIMRHDALEALRQQFTDASLHGVNLFFPDPWPKKRHHKRRIVQPAFVALLGRKIAAGGFFHTATDWAEYADHIDATVAADPAFRAADAQTSKRPETKFELRGRRLGHAIRDRYFERV